jgi:hypothetical protein
MPIFPRKNKRTEFSLRKPMSDQDFLSEIQLSGSVAEDFVKYCRVALGDIFEVDSLIIYPTDKWRDLYNLGCRDWDILEIIDPLERGMKIEITDKQVPILSWNGRKTIGQWIFEFIANCFP